MGVAVNVRSFVHASIRLWITELTAGNQRLGNVKIKCRIFQGDSLTPSIGIGDDTIDIGVKADIGILKSKQASKEH